MAERDFHVVLKAVGVSVSWRMIILQCGRDQYGLNAHSVDPDLMSIESWSSVDRPLFLLLVNATALGSLIRPRAVTRCNLAVSDMYMRDFGKTHQIAYTYCSVGISDLKPLTGTSEDQLPHRKSRSLATA